MSSRIGETVTRSLNIQVEVMHFYITLQGTTTVSTIGINKAIMRIRALLKARDIIQLTSAFFVNEIKKNALFGIVDNKAPLLVRYNDFFFKKTWELKRDLVEAFQKSLDLTRCTPPFNCTSLIIISKVTNVDIVSKLIYFLLQNLPHFPDKLEIVSIEARGFIDTTCPYCLLHFLPRRDSFYEFCLCGR